MISTPFEPLLSPSQVFALPLEPRVPVPIATVSKAKLRHSGFFACLTQAPPSGGLQPTVGAFLLALVSSRLIAAKGRGRSRLCRRAKTREQGNDSSRGRLEHIPQGEGQCEVTTPPENRPLMSFDAPVGGDASRESVASLLYSLGRGLAVVDGEVIALARDACRVLGVMPTLVKLDIPAGARLHVVGDLHGQYDDLVQVLEICGPPMPGQNLFLFNGDFVDRGEQSTEVMLGLLAMLLAYPGCVYLNRGNHESRAMNRHYGFEREVLSKCSVEAFEEFQKLFQSLPLATLVNNSVLVTHGGLPSADGVVLRDIAALDRAQEPRGLMQDLLWSDPTDQDGRHRSPRGGGLSCFGPDVAARFCDENGLLCVIRSHEVCEGGFGWQRGGRVLTVFSAANYVGQVGNLGAVVHVSPRRSGSVELADLSVTTFESRPGITKRRSRL